MWMLSQGLTLPQANSSHHLCKNQATPTTCLSAPEENRMHNEIRLDVAHENSLH